MGSSEKVCTIHIYKFFVARIVYFGDNSENVIWEIEWTITLEVLDGIGHGFGIVCYVVLVVIKSQNIQNC